jgi:hypothetical protein
MKTFRIRMALKVIFFVAIAIAVMGGLVMSLWNWLLPSLAGWHTITFLQAVALLVLCRVLFGGLRSRRGPWRHHWREGLERMTPEERERFRDGLRQHWQCRGESRPTGTPS